MDDHWYHRRTFLSHMVVMMRYMRYMRYMRVRMRMMMAIRRVICSQLPA
jgi:hypothetical protein